MWRRPGLFAVQSRDGAWDVNWLRRQAKGLSWRDGQSTDAVSRSLRAAREVSARLAIVHAITAAADAFYRRHGFVRLPVETPKFALDLVKAQELAEWRGKQRRLMRTVDFRTQTPRGGWNKGMIVVAVDKNQPLANCG